MLGGAYCFVKALGLYFGPYYLVTPPVRQPGQGMGGFFAEALYVYPFTISA